MEIVSAAVASTDHLLPEGEYVFRCTDAKEWRKDRDDGTVSVSLFIEGIVDEGDWKGADAAVWISPKFQNGRALRKAVDALLPEVPESETSLTPDMIEQMKGQRFVAQVEHEPYKGEMKHKIVNTSFSPAPPALNGNGAAPATDDDNTPPPF